MAFEVAMPRLGWATETGRLVEWFKQAGDQVSIGDILFAAEGDKAIQEIEALDSGTLFITAEGLRIGEEVPVGTVLAYLVQPGETFSEESDISSPTVAEAHTQRQTAVASSPEADSTTKDKFRDKPAISPRAARVAAELGVDWTLLEGSGRTGRIVERDVRRAAEQAELAAKVKATPVALRMAESEGIDLAKLAAEKHGAKIRREDIEALIAARQVTPELLTRTAPVGVPEGTGVPIQRIRRLIAHRMMESTQMTAALTLTTEADATELVVLREQVKARYASGGKLVPSYNDLLIKLTSVALQEHPMLNAYWTEDEIIVSPQIHIAMAVDTEAGLLVPVVRDVAEKNLQQIAAETRDLAEKARNRQLKADALQGGTFTITNLGAYGIDAFTPIINLPGQCAILGIGRIIKKPAVWNDQVVPRSMMALSLTFDHRVLDGGPAARFLNTVREYVEQPYLWLTA